MTTLTELKPNCRLHVLVAMALLCDPTTKETITDKTGWSDEAVRDALRWLSRPEQNLAMAIPNGRHPLWCLTRQARAMLEPIRHFLDTAPPLSPLPADSDAPAPALLSPLPADSVNARSQLPLSKPGSFQAQPRRQPVTDRVESAPSGLTAPTTSSLNMYVNNDDDLRAMLEALRAAGVHHQMRRGLAAELLADTATDWLRQTLGWIAYLADEGARQPGATIYPALRDRQPCPDDRYLPPEAMPFAPALAWSMAGGRLAPAEPEPPAPLVVETDDAPPLAGAAALWAAALESLRLELPAATMPRLRLCSLAGDPPALTLRCPSRFDRDWLQNRMTAVLTRVLAPLAGQPITLSYEAPA